MNENIANDQAYIGVNAAGEHLYWKAASIAAFHTATT